MDPIIITTDLVLTPQLVTQVAREMPRISLSEESRAAIEQCRASLETVLNDGSPHYGINTGFGSLSNQRIEHEDLENLQRNLIRSHAAGIGDPLEDEIVRGMMFVLVCSLSRAKSGVRVELVELLISMLNHGITPIVPELGSVGASGDLAPLAHVAQAMIGEGKVKVQGREVDALAALQDASIKPMTLKAKEGLALINGTHLMTARFSLIYQDLEQLIDTALIANAMSIDAARASHGYLDPRIYEARNQPGASEVATTMRSLLDGSTIVESHAENDPRVQDPYSFRCAPLVMGAVLDSLRSCQSSLLNELGAVTDNPLIFETTKETPDIVSAGCFHGMPVALPLDTLAIGIAHLAGISERRMYHILSVFDPESQLRAFMSPKPGVMSGFMIVQYAAAAICNELIGLANPASVANLSTCAGMEDYNSFGPRSAAKASRALKLARSVIASELLCSAEGIECHRPHTSGHRIEAAITAIREVVAPLTEDRTPSPDIAAIEELIRSDRFAFEL
ncbi:hutH [Symbiodinium sp. CCMP2592]|nr:hutH [Symbiodinium sp. CCMP2592]